MTTTPAFPPPEPAPASDVVPPPEPGRSWVCDLRVGAAVTGLVTAGGLVMAVVWWLVAPTAAFHVVDGAVDLVTPSGKAYVAAEGWYAVLAALAGIASAAVAYRWTRRSGVAVVLGLAVGGLLASVVMWRVGSWLGPDPVLVQAKGAGPTDTLHLPLELRAKGVLFVWPIVSVVLCFGLVAGFQQPEPRPAPAWRSWGRSRPPAPLAPAGWGDPSGNPAPPPSAGWADPSGTPAPPPSAEQR